MATRHNASDFAKGDKVNYVSKDGEKTYGVILKIMPKEEKVVIERASDNAEVTIKAERVMKNRGRPSGSTNAKAEPEIKKTQQTSKKAAKASDKEELDEDEIENIRDSVMEMMAALGAIAARLGRALGEEDSGDKEKDEEEVSKKKNKPTADGETD